ncbi:hypothetical protein F4815DRAFT_492561 [Daldinia loculata]|nr:hypothetical protein F4815DRAFT_492561 [Daldinia loculata]
MASSRDIELSQIQSAYIFLALPAELLDKIVYELSLNDLYYWSLTCTKFSNKILPILYKLDLGIDPYKKDREEPYGSYRSLAWACQYGLRGTFEMARKSGADLNHFFELQSGLLDQSFLSPLQVALVYGHEDLAECLIEAGADVTAIASCNGNYSAMHFATSVSMVKRLYAACWTPEIHRLHVPYRSVIWWMLQRGAGLDAMEAALDIGVSVDDEGCGLSMLHACGDHRLDVVRLLLSRGFRFEEQSVLEENLAIGIPGVCEQLCLTLALQRAVLGTSDASTTTELIRLLFEVYMNSGKLDYRSEITWLVLATGAGMPLAVRSLLWDSLVVPCGLPQSSDLAETWEKETVGYIMDMVHDILTGDDGVVELLHGNLRSILRSIGLCLWAEGGFDWVRVQPLVKTLIQESHEHIDIVCTYPTHFTNLHLSKNDEALTLELIDILLKNGADAEAKLGDEEYGADLLHRSVGIGAFGRVKVLTDYGARIDPPTLQEMEYPIMFVRDDLDEELRAKMVKAQKEIAHFLNLKRKGLRKKSNSS